MMNGTTMMHQLSVHNLDSLAMVCLTHFSFVLFVLSKYFICAPILMFHFASHLRLLCVYLSFQELYQYLVGHLEMTVCQLKYEVSAAMGVKMDC